LYGTTLRDGAVAVAVAVDDDDDEGLPPGGPASSWSEEKSSAHGPIVCVVGVSFNAATRRRFTSLSPPTDQAYLSDLVVFESERGEGLGRAMLRAAETFARDMKSAYMYLHVATKKPGVVRLYRGAGYSIRGVDPGLFGWRGRLLMRKEMAEDAAVAKREYSIHRDRE
jgi:ribosomal protein S18 acetylase RimI-like enzyme